jgi:hypothetical protein
VTSSPSPGGAEQGTKVTGANGLNLSINLVTPVFNRQRHLTTTVVGHVYSRPANGI